MKRQSGIALVMAAVMAVTSISITSTPETVSAASSLSDIYERQEAIQKELDKANANLKNLEGQIAEAESYQAELSNQISLNRDKISLYESQISALSDEIAATEETVAVKETDIAAKETEINDTYEIFKARMTAIYKAGETSSLEMLFSSESFADFFTTIRLMQAVSEHDEQLVDTLRVQKTELETEKQELQEYLTQIEEDKAEIETAKADIQATQKELEVSYAASETAMQDLEALERRYTEDKEKALEEDAAIEAELEEWFRQQAANNGGNTGDLDSDFIWPLPGYSYVSSPYGSRWGSIHTGMDITGGGVYGANIVAASSGVVTRVVNMHYSYGNYLIIDHGGGHSTLYAHCSQLLVSEGDTVYKGQTVALVGSTGNSTGPHLHFEVRINGAHTNPANYVSY